MRFSARIAVLAALAITGAAQAQDYAAFAFENAMTPA